MRKLNIKQKISFSILLASLMIGGFYMLYSNYTNSKIVMTDECQVYYNLCKHGGVLVIDNVNNSLCECKFKDNTTYFAVLVQREKQLGNLTFKMKTGVLYLWP